MSVLSPNEFNPAHDDACFDSTDLDRVIFYGIVIGLPCTILAGPVFGTWLASYIV